jgi:hypothetical protein
MFNLEPSIAEWRRQMLAAGIKAPVPLDELETHLREEFERQIQSGKSAPEAFRIAMGKIGQAPVLKKEFQKANAPIEMPQIIKLAGITCVATALISSLAVCFPMFLHLLPIPG